MSKSNMLMEYIVSDIVNYIIEDNVISLETAMSLLYNSRTFEKLHDIETGLYLNGSTYVYEIFKEEQKAANAIVNQ